MSIDLSLYPQFDDGQLVSPGVGQYSIYTRQGGQQTPTVDVLGTYVGQSYGSRLNPNTRMVVSGTSASLPGLVAVQNPTGCNTPTGQEIPIALPYDLTTQFDLYGLPTIGSPQAGDAIQTLLTSNNDPVVSYRVTDPKVKGKAKYLSGAYAGEATKITAYGDYPWIDDNGKQYPSLGKADPSRLKPRWDLLYNHGQFTVNPKTNELTLTTHGGDGSAYGQGKNILLIPGAPPTLAMTVTVNAGGSVDVGGRLIAYSRTIADPLGTFKDTDLSPTTYVNTIAGQQSIAYSIPPATDTTTATEYKIWSTKPNDPTGDFYLADTRTGIDPTTTVTGTLSAADASLSTVFVGTQTVIHVDDNVSLFGVLRADGGTQTISVPHTPVVDADIPWPTTFGTIRDGLTAVSTADDSFQWRSNNAWHSITAGGGGGGGGGAGTGAANYSLSTNWHGMAHTTASITYAPWDTLLNGDNVYLDATHTDGLTIPASGGGDYLIHANLRMDIHASATVAWATEYTLSIEHWRGSTQLLYLHRQDLYEQMADDDLWNDIVRTITGTVTGTQPGDVIKIGLSLADSGSATGSDYVWSTPDSWVSIAPVGVAAGSTSPVAMSTSLNLATVPGPASLAGRATLGWSGVLQVDQGGWATAGTSGTTGIIVIPTTGTYNVSALLQLDTGFNTLTYGESMRVEVRINGAPPNNFMIYDMTSLHNPTISFLDFIDFTAGDQVEIRLYDENITTNPHLDIQSGYINLSRI